MKNEKTRMNPQERWKVSGFITLSLELIKRKRNIELHRRSLSNYMTRNNKDSLDVQTYIDYMEQETYLKVGRPKKNKSQ